MLNDAEMQKKKKKKKKKRKKKKKNTEQNRILNTSPKCLCSRVEVVILYENAAYSWFIRAALFYFGT